MLLFFTKITISSEWKHFLIIHMNMNIMRRREEWVFCVVSNYPEGYPEKVGRRENIVIFTQNTHIIYVFDMTHKMMNCEKFHLKIYFCSAEPCRASSKKGGIFFFSIVIHSFIGSHQNCSDGVIYVMVKRMISKSFSHWISF